MKPNIWEISIKDYFSTKMLAYAFAPFIATLIMFILFLSPVYNTLMDSENSSTIQIETSQTTYQDGSSNTESTHVIYDGDSPLLDFLLNNSVISWLILTFSFFLLAMAMFVIAMITAIFIIGFLTPAIMREVQKRHYPEIPLEEHGSVLTGILESMKYVMVMFLLLILMIPLYFIPFLNIVAVNLPFYYLFHKFYMLDVGTTAMTKEQFKQMMYFNANKVRMTTGLLYLLSMVPLAALFTPVFNVIVLAHTVMRSKQEQLSTTPSQTA